MGTPSAGSVAIVPFPFSNLAQAKRRPALVLANADRGDWILCQVTSKAYSDPRAVTIATADFHIGGLRLMSFAHPGKLFTAHQSIFLDEAGQLLPSVTRKIIKAVVAVIQGKKPS